MVEGWLNDGRNDELDLGSPRLSATVAAGFIFVFLQQISQFLDYIREGSGEPESITMAYDGTATAFPNPCLQWVTIETANGLQQEF